MKEVVKCKYCGGYEYYGEMRCLSGRCQCRNCYKAHFEEVNHALYTWDDLNGPRPTPEEIAKTYAEVRSELDKQLEYCMDEMNADEVVRALHVLCGYDGKSCDGVCSNCPADQFRKNHPNGACDDGTMSAAFVLIESLQSQLAEYREAAREYGIDAKTMLELAKSQIKTAKMNNEILQALDDLEEYLIDEIAISREAKKREDETETGRAKALGRELAYCNCFDLVSEILDKGGE